MARKGQLNDYKVIRQMGIFSTMIGYDVKVFKKSESYQLQSGCRKFKVYKNISASSMRRFYRLSEYDIDAYGEKWIGYQDHSRLFPVNW